MVIRQTLDGVEVETEVLLPDFGDRDEPEQTPIGIWGQRHLRYLRDYKEPLFMELLMEGKLNSCLADIDLSCDELFANGETVKTPFDGLMAFTDATQLWGLNESTFF